MSELSKYPFILKTEKGQIDERLYFHDGRLAWLVFLPCPQKAIPGFAPGLGYVVEWKLFEKPSSSGECLVIAQGETPPMTGGGASRRRAILDIVALLDKDLP